MSGRLAMPMIDATIPEGALKPEVEERLLKEISDILIRAEGYTPETNKIAQGRTWLLLHRPAAVYVAGAVRCTALPHRHDRAGGAIHRRRARGFAKGSHRGGGTRRWRQLRGCRASGLGISS